MFQLTGEQSNALNEAVRSAFPSPDKLRNVVFQKMSINIFDHTSAAKGYIDIVWDLFFHFTAHDLLLKFVRVLHEENSTNPELNSFVASLPEAFIRPNSNPTLDPYEVRCLWGSSKMPFINRSELRSNLKKLATPGGLPVAMVINGEKGTGKTYTARLIEFISNKYDEISVMPFHLDDKNETSKLDAGELMRQISRRLDFDTNTLPEQTSGDAKWAGELCDWFAGKMLRRSMELAVIPGQIVPTLWLVIDGIQQASLPASTDFLIKGLVARAGDNFPNLRVILLDYKEPLIAIQPRIEMEDIVRPGRTDLRDFFMEMLKLQQKQVDNLDDLIRDDIEEIIAELERDDAVGLHALPGRLRNLEQKLMEQLP